MGILFVIIPNASNGSLFCCILAWPVTGFISPVNKLDLPTVCCSNSYATLALNSFCNCLAPN